MSLLGRLELVKRFSARAAVTTPIAVTADTAAARIVRMYTANARIIDALAKEYGFEVVYVWQPVLMSSKKRLTAREQWLTSTIETDPWARTIRDVHVAVPPLLTAAMRPTVGARFVDGTNLFEDDTTDVYADLFGHTFGYANPRVVAATLPQLVAVAAGVARRRAQ